MSVDLPAPLSPINPTTSPSLTSSETEFNAVIPPNVLLMFLNSIIGSIEDDFFGRYGYTF